MKERGIIFNAEMVRAILDGRKTQTRRIMKPQPVPINSGANHVWYCEKIDASLDVKDALQDGNVGWYGLISSVCPLGGVGDRLWVCETWQCGLCTESTFAYKATHKPSDLEEGWNEIIKWRPSSQMPRWASRILLEITGVRVERLQYISGEDARSEGFICTDSPVMGDIDEFSHTWKLTYGEDSWPANPWVWVIEFRQIQEG